MGDLNIGDVLSLRDYFAAHAMMGFLACDSIQTTKGDPDEVLAISSYMAADAMLKEREKRDEDE